MLIIINADDLGATKAINTEIFDLMQAGLVTSSTIISNAPAFEDAARLVHRFPHCSFGVHLNLTDFKPLTSSTDLAPLLDARGCFSRSLFKPARCLRLRRALLRELIAQVQRALDAGIPVTHLDSHHHVHTAPALFPLLKFVQWWFGIRKVRATITQPPPGRRSTLLTRFKKCAFRFALSRVYTTACPEGLGDFRDFHAALQRGRSIPCRALELMVHPGAAGETYQAEIRALRSNWRALLPGGARLGSYHQI